MKHRYRTGGNLPSRYVEEFWQQLVGIDSPSVIVGHDARQSMIHDDDRKRVSQQ